MFNLNNLHYESWLAVASGRHDAASASKK